jgi:glycosyltransferase involved in cell wall biosynthesis
MRNALGYAEEDVVLIMVARFHPGKGHPVLLGAIRDLLDRGAKVKLICLGEGNERAEIRRLANELGLKNHVRFEGYQKNVPVWLQAADINVLPTFYEGLPLTVLEAMASGLPTVASNVGGIPEIVEDGISGWLVPSGDPKKLADALSLLVWQPERRRRMGEAAYSRVCRCFSLDQQVRDTERLYLELCGTPAVEGSGESVVPVIAARGSQQNISLH